MTEIEQLRADIATLEAAEELHKRLYNNIPQGLLNEISIMKLRLSKLEAEAKDPWFDAKEKILKWGGTHHGADHPLKTVTEYVRHLESELANRPVVWCARDYNGNLVKVKHGNLSYTLVFPTREIANQCSEGGAEIYMGEQE